jgi:trimethylguanosine synthase
MVKKLRQTNVSGLTRFLQAFDEPSLSPTGSTVLVEPSTPPPEPKSDSVDLEIQRATGKRKTGLLGPGNEAYDATGLVPFYTEVSQVPAHLQKCMSLYKRIGV